MLGQIFTIQDTSLYLLCDHRQSLHSLISNQVLAELFFFHFRRLFNVELNPKNNLSQYFIIKNSK